jgi:NAD(P)-dependent dehydrogenase (short-subunit alcohol dehydrogenase family)
MSNRFEGKVVAITGSGSGLGRETARIVGSEGGKAVICDLTDVRVKDAVSLVEGEGGTAAGIVADVRSAADMERFVAFAVETYGRLDAMHANAGIPEPSLGTPLHEKTDADWDAIFDVNARGVFNAFRAAVAQFLRQGGGGTLLATTSAAGSFVYQNFPLYGASKWAANGIAKNFAVEYGPHGIRCNALAPFHGMSANFLMPPDAPVLGQSYEQLAHWDPAGNPGAMPLAMPEPPSLRDNANLAAFLLSDESRYITGEVIHSASGGTSARVAINFQAAAAGDVLPEDQRENLDNAG